MSYRITVIIVQLLSVRDLVSLLFCLIFCFFLFDNNLLFGEVEREHKVFSWGVVRCYCKWRVLSSYVWYSMNTCGELVNEMSAIETSVNTPC